MASAAEHPVIVYQHFLERLTVKDLRLEAARVIYRKDETLDSGCDA